MELMEHRCKRCGGELLRAEDAFWKCPYCGCTFDDASAERNAKTLHELFDREKEERINNLRRCLYDAVTADNISSIEISERCKEIKAYLPDDFAACFFEVAVGNDDNRLSRFIRRIDVEKNYADIDLAVEFLVRSLKSEFLLELNSLIERTYKTKDLSLYEKYSTAVSREASKVENGVYETKLPRDVFVAYSSRDMEHVIDLVSFLEEQGLSCFVAARNLRHGKGAVENYDAAIKEAIDHCRSFLFVSSTKSRTLSCDALEIELPYVRRTDIENAPHEYRHSYNMIPHSYKKPRVEYRLEESKKYNAADVITDEFFDGYERVYSKEEAASRIIKQIIGINDHIPKSELQAENGEGKAVKKQDIKISEQKKKEPVPEKTRKADASADLNPYKNTVKHTTDKNENFEGAIHKKGENSKKVKAVGNKIRKIVFLIFAVFSLMMALGSLLSVVTDPEMWCAFAFFAIFSAMFFILAYSPKEKKRILGKEKGIPKTLFVIACIVLAWSMMIVSSFVS